MIAQKFIVIVLSSILALLQPIVSQKYVKDKLPEQTFVNKNIDSVFASVKSSGWSIDRLYFYHQYIINSLTPPEDELKIINSLPESSSSSFLRTIVMKKMKLFPAMFDTLFNRLKQQPKYSPYYEELVFAASATSQIARLEIAIKEDERLKNIRINWLLGLIHIAKSEYKNAVDYLIKAAQRDENNPHIFFQLSNAYRSLGNYPLALSYIDSAGFFGKDDFFTAKYLLAKGALYYLSGKHKEAESEYTKALILSVKNHFNLFNAKALISIGILEDVKGDVDGARSKFNEALKIAAGINDLETEAHSHSELGVSYTFTNELVDAKKMYLKSFELYKLVSNRLRISLVANNLGKIYLNMFDYQSAMEYFGEGIASAGENKRAKVLNLIGMADTYSNLANYAKALKYYKDAQNLSSEIKEIDLSSEIGTGLGVLNFNLDRFGNALKYFAYAAKHANSIGNPYLKADAFHKIGLTYYNLDSLNLSERFLLKAIETAKQCNDVYTEAVSSCDIAFLYLSKNSLSEAQNFLSIAEKLADKNQLKLLKAEHKLLRGQIAEHQNNFDAAQFSYKEAVYQAKNINNFNLMIEGYYLLGKLFEKNGFNYAAESFYRSAVNLIDDVSRPLFEEQEVQIFYLSSRYQIYTALASLLLDQNKYKAAFELIEKSRSRNLIQNLNNIKLQAIINNKPLLDSLYEFEWRVHSEGGDNEAVKIEYNSFKKEILNKYPSAKKYLNLSTAFSLESFQKELGSGEEYISVFSTAQNTYLFKINKNNFKHYITAEGKEAVKKHIAEISPYFDAQVDSKTFFNQDLFAFNSKSSFIFYNKFFADVFNEINKKSNVIIAPSIEIVSFPFEFLVTSFDEKKSAYSYSNNSYLINDYKISYTPSAASYVEQKKNKFKNNGNVLIVGDPDINAEIEGFSERRGLLEEGSGIPRNVSLLPLKYSGEEVDAISKIINADKVLIRRDATETAFKNNAESSGIIHLSTHSFLYKRQPVIFFSNYYDSENDGFLESNEIVRLKLNSDMVVLSSCNSGLGTVSESEGIVGMTKAFFEAGSKSIVVSLWEVNDKYTSKFMSLFYKHLSSGLDKSEALRLTKLDFIKQQSPNPYFWGAFVLAGNTSSLKFEDSSEVNGYLIVAVILILIIAGYVLYRRGRK